MQEMAVWEVAHVEGTVRAKDMGESREAVAQRGPRLYRLATVEGGPARESAPRFAPY